jgi:hypothetical protein
LSDVTLTVTDVRSRIGALNTVIQRLEKLQAEAVNVTDLLAIEAELASRSAERDSLQSQDNYLKDQVAMATVYVGLHSQKQDVTTDTDFIGSVKDGFSALISILSNLVNLVGFLIPILAAPVTTMLAVYAWLRVRGRKRKNKQDTSSS